MKRPSAAMSAVSAKRAKITPIVNSISEAGALTKEVKELMEGSLKIALGEFKELRHPFMSEVIGMAEKSMGEIEAAMASEVVTLKAKAADMMKVEVEKGKRVAAKDAAAAEVAACEGALAGKKETAASATTALKEAQGALKAAKSEAGKAGAAADTAEATWKAHAFSTSICCTKEGFEPPSALDIFWQPVMAVAA